MEHAHAPAREGRELALGVVIRHERERAGLSLSDLARRALCTKSYLSAIETGKRERPPRDAIVRRLESALGLAAGSLMASARWQATPGEIKREMVSLAARVRAARELATLVRSDTGGKASGGLDEAYRSGRLARLVSRLAPEEGAGAGGRERGGSAGGDGVGAGIGGVARLLPLEVPLINRVAAGYPTEFTDLSYPARVADEYVRCPDINDPDAFAARVVGESMRPKYEEGDIVVFSPARAVKDGADCFARLEPDHASTFKRVYFETGEGGEELVRLQPLNPAFSARVVERERVAGLYAAVSVIKAV
ncbi:MAG: helix-turn-helix domain-containing protein [Phycisphaerae bacterium]|nr:helix-turn-helix domain-containing protein [Phycisphaerae bacterium]